MTAPTRHALVSPDMRCDEPGCPNAIAVRIGAEQLCYRHALARGNAERAARGLLPVIVDEDGDVHVQQ